MNIEVYYTTSFSEDLTRLSSTQKKVVEREIDTVSQSFLNGKTEFKANSSIPYIFNLKGGLDSSLYLIKVDPALRVIATVDEDPMFDKISLTLFRLVDKANAEDDYKQVGEEIYRKLNILE